MRQKIAVIGLTLVGIGALLLILRQSGPGLLERYGLYLGQSQYEAQTVERTAGLPTQYVDSDTCSQCHQSRYEQWEQSQHSGVACEACHGPGQAHVQGAATLYRPATRDACGTCHDRLDARPASFPQVSLTQHYPQSACTACHDSKGPASYIPHPVPQDANCALCHSAQGQGLASLSASHVGYTIKGCQVCHWPAATPSQTPSSEPSPTPTSAEATPSSTPAQSTVASGPPPISHALDGRSLCLACHGGGVTGATVVPANHAGYTNSVCLGCHRRSDS